MFKKIITSLVLLSLSALSHAWPERPVKIIVPYGPGGGNDVIARLVGQELSNIWKQPVLIDNRPGGQATIGVAIAARAEPDGHTLVIVQPNILASSSVLVDDVQYNWEKDLIAVGFVGAAPPFVLAVSPKLGVKTISELQEYGKNKGLSYASAGSGSPLHLYSALLTQGLGVNGIHVPYKASPAAIIDVINGSVDMIFGTPAQVIPHARSGALIALSVVGDRTYDKLPGVPPMSLANIKDFPNIHTSYALYVPAATPPAIRQKLATDIARAYENILPELASRNLVDPSATVPHNVARQALEDGRTWVRITRRVKN